MTNSKKLIALVLAIVAAIAFSFASVRDTAAYFADTFAGGVSGSVNRNALLRSAGNGKVAGADIADDGTKITVSGQWVPYGTKTALTSSTSITIDSTVGNFFTLTAGHTANINATTVGASGQPLILKVLTSGTSSFTLTFNTNFKSTGTLATGTVDAKTFVITFISDGTNYVEVSRTAAQ
jgi:hypothetical protein